MDPGANNVVASARPRAGDSETELQSAPQDPGSLTYEPYFGLREKPFSLSSDPRFFYSHSSHGTSLDTLTAGIRRREGILALMGEVGTGKTTLCRAVLQALDRRTFAAFVPDPFLSREDLLKTLLIDFGIVSADEIRSGRLRGASRTDLSYPLYDFLASLQPLKAFAVVMIDEAHNLTTDLLEEIRILSDLEKNHEKLLEVMLIGQPELRDRLASTEMRQLAQRVSLRCELVPSVPEAVKAVHLAPVGCRWQRRKGEIHRTGGRVRGHGLEWNSTSRQSDLRPRAAQGGTVGHVDRQRGTRRVGGNRPSDADVPAAAATASAATTRGSASARGRCAFGVGEQTTDRT